MALSITPAAAEVLRAAMQKEGVSPADAYLRVGVKGGGCSGMSYNLSFDKAPTKFDTVQESEGIRMLVDRKSYLFINGTRIDYGGKNVFSRGFQFENPNVVQACGCGTSFTVE
jgi:iron-sulfur cluster assembly protein